MLAPKTSDSAVSPAGPLGDRSPSPRGHSRARSPLHRGFVGAGSVLLIAAFFTDYTYCTTELWQWANFSAWLITAGLMVMLAAVLLLLVDFTTGRASRLNTGAFLPAVVAGLLSLLNAFVHSRDAWTSVASLGIVLSAASAILLAIVGAQGWKLAISRASKERT